MKTAFVLAAAVTVFYLNIAECRFFGGSANQWFGGGGGLFGGGSIFDNNGRDDDDADDDAENNDDFEDEVAREWAAASQMMDGFIGIATAIGGAAIRRAAEVVNNDTTGKLPDKAVCSQAIRIEDTCAGSMDRTTIRWFHNGTAKECQPFYGCKVEENSNNFDTPYACSKVCNANFSQVWPGGEHGFINATNDMRAILDDVFGAGDGDNDDGDEETGSANSFNSFGSLFGNLMGSFVSGASRAIASGYNATGSNDGIPSWARGGWRPSHNENGDNTGNGNVMVID